MCGKLLLSNKFKNEIYSNNKELVELTGKLLLAAKLQEGVRQQICENMDSGLQENFEYMFKIIYDNNLIRFSSVKRALATWTGLTRDESDDISKFGKKELEIINKLIANPKYEDELLKSDDNIEIDKYDIDVSITHDKVNAIAIIIIEERGKLITRNFARNTVFWRNCT